MFTSNGKIYGKRDSDLRNGHSRLGCMHVDTSRAYAEDLLGRPSSRTDLRADGTRNYNEDQFERRLASQCVGNRGFEEEILKHRRRDPRNVGKRMHGKEVLNRRSDIRTGVDGCKFDEESLTCSDHGYGVPPKIAKKQCNGSQQTHGNQLLNLRAALNEKELQLVELREQHINVVNRAEDERQNWEEAVKSKDRVILQLQKTLHHKKSSFERQEREFQENVHRALRQRQKEEHVEVEKKGLKIALLEAKNAQFVQELVEQQKLITRMKRQIEDKEKYRASHIHKMEMMNGRVQDLKAALQDKEEVAETKSNYCNELKTLLWKRDSMIAQLQLAEQQLQSTLARQEAAYEALVVSRDKLQDEKALIDKKLLDLRNQVSALENVGSRGSNARGHRQAELRKLTELKDNFNIVQGGLKDLNDRDGVLHRLQKRMREMQQALRNKDIALSTQNGEYQEALEENLRLTVEYEALKREYEDLSKRNTELEASLAHMQDQLVDGQMNVSISEDSTPPVDVLPCGLSQGGSIGEDLGLDDALLESIDSEQLSNASVYHANFEKIKIVEVETTSIAPKKQQTQAPPASPPALPRTPAPLQPPPPVAASPQPSPSPPPGESDMPAAEPDNSFKSIQDEILKREQCWRKTEELMRAALTRRMKLLEEPKEVHRSEKQEWDDRAKVNTYMNQKYNFGQESCTDRRKQIEIDRHIDRQKMCEHESQVDRRKHVEDESVLDNRIHTGREPGKNFDPDICRDRQKTNEQDSYLDQRKNNDFENYRTQYHEDNLIQHNEQAHTLDRRKNAQRTAQLENSSQYDHYGHYKRSGHHSQSAHMRRGKML